MTHERLVPPPLRGGGISHPPIRGWGQETSRDETPNNHRPRAVTPIFPPLGPEGFEVEMGARG